MTSFYPTFYLDDSDLLPFGATPNWQGMNMLPSGPIMPQSQQRFLAPDQFSRYYQTIEVRSCKRSSKTTTFQKEALE
jgi:hypothetical protein